MMRLRKLPSSASYQAALALLILGILRWPLPAQDSPTHFSDFASQPILPKNCLAAAYQTMETPSSTGPLRFPLFRMPTGFIQDPVGLQDDDPNIPETDGALAGNDAPGSRVGLAMGQDNPYFDLREPGTPGGVGYYAMYSQYQLFDTPSTNLGLAFQAATPAGIDGDGVSGGPTIMRPAVAYFHETDSGLALQGFVGKTLAARSRWTDNLERSLHYGVAVASPVPGLPERTDGAVHMFVEALGRSQNAENTTWRYPAGWQLLPGLHWRVGDNWWMSGGLIVPVGSSRFESGLWQVTCSWRF